MFSIIMERIHSAGMSRVNETPVQTRRPRDAEKDAESKIVAWVFNPYIFSVQKEGTGWKPVLRAFISPFCSAVVLRVSASPWLPLIVALILMLTTSTMASDSPQPASVADVKIMPGFWADRIATVRNKTIEHNFEECDSHGRFRNFDRAAGKDQSPWEGKFFFDDSDPYKVIEGAAYVLMQKPDPDLEKQIDDYIAGSRRRSDRMGIWILGMR